MRSEKYRTRRFFSYLHVHITQAQYDKIKEIYILCLYICIHTFQFLLIIFIKEMIVISHFYVNYEFVNIIII